MTASLRTLHILQAIQVQIRSNGNSLSWARIKKMKIGTEQELSDALDYGTDKDLIKWNQYNIYNVKKDCIINEEMFYDDVQASISALWKSEHYADHEFYMENTSRKDSKIEGRWTRPDLTLVSHKKFPWTIGREFDVVTFEIKSPTTCNVLGVFEALSHLSSATKAYVVFPLNQSDWIAQSPAQAARVQEECSRHGVGLILVENTFESPTAKHLVKALRREVDHEKCSSFLGSVMSAAGKDRISTWK